MLHKIHGFTLRIIKRGTFACLRQARLRLQAALRSRAVAKPCPNKSLAVYWLVFSSTDLLTNSENEFLLTDYSASLLLGALGINAFSSLLPDYPKGCRVFGNFLLAINCNELLSAFGRLCFTYNALAVPFDFVRRQAVRR
jgi:hypothetical protein